MLSPAVLSALAVKEELFTVLDMWFDPWLEAGQAASSANPSATLARTTSTCGVGQNSWGPGALTRYCRSSPRCGACMAEGAAVTVLSVVLMVLVGFVLVVAVLVVIFRLRQRRIASRRGQAVDLRGRSQQQGLAVEQSEIEERRAKAEAREAHAVADQQSAEADRLRAKADDLDLVARRKTDAVEHRRDEQQQTLRRADEVDPDSHARTGRDVHDDADRPGGPDAARNGGSGGSGEASS